MPAACQGPIIPTRAPSPMAHRPAMPRVLFRFPTHVHGPARRFSHVLLLVLACLAAPLPGRAADRLLSLQVGEVRVLAVPDVARVAVGGGPVVNAVTTEENDGIGFGGREGSTVVQVWSEDGTRHRFDVEVAPEGARRLQQELRAVLERIPNARVSAVGDKLIVEGDDLSDADRERLAQLGERYPQLVD